MYKNDSIDNQLYIFIRSVQHSKNGIWLRVKLMNKVLWINATVIFLSFFASNTVFAKNKMVNDIKPFQEHKHVMPEITNKMHMSKDMSVMKNMQSMNTSSKNPSMTMIPYFTAINYPLKKHSVMLMVLPDYQVARYGNNFFTGMLMGEYGLTSRLTVGIMAEGQKIEGQPVTFGGMRYNAYFHLFRDDQFLNITLYGEYEDLNEAALYKMEVAGFGPEDLLEPLKLARDTSVRTFEQRIIVYHDWKRLNATFNFIRESPLQSPYTNDYGYAFGLFIKPIWMSGAMMGMSDMAKPPIFSMSRLGYGLELIGALGNDQRFGFYWDSEQSYLGPVFTYNISSACVVRLEPAFGLSNVSDPFVLRMGLSYMF